MEDQIRKFIRGQIVTSYVLFTINGLQMQDKSKAEQDEILEKFLETQVEEFLYGLQKIGLSIVPKEQIPEAFLR